MQITINDISFETVQKGRNNYEKAVVKYNKDGKPLTQTLVSFSNPAVFKAVKELTAGDIVDVTVTKEGDYYQWASVTKTSKAAAASSGSTNATGGRVTGSNYETREERQARQVLIVRQSCLAQAVEFSKVAYTDGLTKTAVLDIANDFVDWVFQQPDLFDQPNDLGSSE